MPETGLVCVNEKPSPSAPLSSKLFLRLKSAACDSSLTSCECSAAIHPYCIIHLQMFQEPSLIPLMYVMGLFCACSTPFVYVVNYNYGLSEQFSGFKQGPRGCQAGWARGRGAGSCPGAL